MGTQQRNNTVVVAKTFRFNPQLVDDMERAIYFSQDEAGRKKYKSMTGFIVSAVQKQINEERRRAERKGVIWEYLPNDFKQFMKEDKQKGTGNE